MNDWARNIGVPLRAFIKSEWVTLGNAAKVFRITPQAVSQYVNGKRKVPRRIQIILKEAGFDDSIFSHYITGEEISVDNPEDYRYLINKYQAYLNRIETLATSAEAYNHYFQEIIQEKNKSISQLKAHINTLAATNAKLRLKHDSLQDCLVTLLHITVKLSCDTY